MFETWSRPGDLHNQEKGLEVKMTMEPEARWTDFESFSQDFHHPEFSKGHMWFILNELSPRISLATFVQCVALEDNFFSLPAHSVPTGVRKTSNIINGNRLDLPLAPRLRSTET